MIQLNLLPDVKKAYMKAQHLKRNIMTGAVLASGVAIVLVVLLFLYVHGAQKVARDQLQNDINKNSQTLQKTPDLEKVLTVQAALQTLPGLHDKKALTSRLFEYLKVLIPNDVSLTRLDLNEKDHTLKINGVAGSYKSLNTFADMLKNAQLASGPDDKRVNNASFQKVTLVQANKSTDQQSGGKIDFTINASFDPILFQSKTINPAMSVPSITTGEGISQSKQLFQGQNTGSTQ